jgi:hypothetical protein
MRTILSNRGPETLDSLGSIRRANPIRKPLRFLLILLPLDILIGVESNSPLVADRFGQLRAAEQRFLSLCLFQDADLNPELLTKRKVHKNKGHGFCPRPLLVQIW